MKLASLHSGRDGQLMLVDSSLTRMTHAEPIASTLQYALDNWDACIDELMLFSEKLEDDTIASQAYNPALLHSPLPRAYQWLDASAYINHVELVRKARNAEVPESYYKEPLMYQGGSDSFLKPTEDIVMPEIEPYGIDFEAEVAVVVGDVPRGVGRSEALECIRLVMLVNDVSLRGLIPDELGKGFGFLQSKPSSSFSPVCVTPDSLGSAWSNGKLHLPISSIVNKSQFGIPHAGVDMTFDFGQLIAHAAKTRALTAGTIIGSGTVSNKLNDGPGKPIDRGGVGYSCIAELRMIETIESGAPSTSFLREGDTVSIESFNNEGNSVFGKIMQTVRVGR